MDFADLPPGQQRTYNAILALYAINGSCPTYREIASYLGNSSAAAVVYHINALQKKGFLKHRFTDGARSRGIIVPSIHRAILNAARQLLAETSKAQLDAVEVDMETLTEEPGKKH